MVVKVAKQYDKEALILNWRTGDFTTRQLGDKYGLSHVMVNRIVGGIPKDLKPVIEEKVKILARGNEQLKPIIEQHKEVTKKVNSELQKLPDLLPSELTVVDESVSYKLSLLKDIQDFTGIAISQAKLLASVSESGADLKACVDAVDRIAITNGLAERHAKASSTLVNTGNTYLAQINNMSLEELDREIANLERVL